MWTTSVEGRKTSISKEGAEFEVDRTVDTKKRERPKNNEKEKIKKFATQSKFSMIAKETTIQQFIKLTHKVNTSVDREIPNHLHRNYISYNQLPYFYLIEFVQIMVHNTG